MTARLAISVIELIVWLFSFVRPKKRVKFVFYKVRTGGITVWGDITKMKKEFGFTSTFNGVAEGPVGSDYEHGTEVWEARFADKDGNDRSSDYTVAVDPSNPLRATISHSGTQESIGTLELRADGDPDADETAPVRGSVDIITDAPNVTGFALTEETSAPAPEV